MTVVRIVCVTAFILFSVFGFFFLIVSSYTVRFLGILSSFFLLQVP